MLFSNNSYKLLPIYSWLDIFYRSTWIHTSTANFVVLRWELAKASKKSTSNTSGMYILVKWLNINWNYLKLKSEDWNVLIFVRICRRPSIHHELFQNVRNVICISNRWNCWTNIMLMFILSEILKILISIWDKSLEFNKICYWTFIWFWLVDSEADFSIFKSKFLYVLSKVSLNWSEQRRPTQMRSRAAFSKNLLIKGQIFG
jgi:hypothetical protein